MLRGPQMESAPLPGTPAQRPGAQDRNRRELGRQRVPDHALYARLVSVTGLWSSAPPAVAFWGGQAYQSFHQGGGPRPPLLHKVKDLGEAAQQRQGKVLEVRRFPRVGAAFLGPGPGGDGASQVSTCEGGKRVRLRHSVQ